MKFTSFLGLFGDRRGARENSKRRKDLRRTRLQVETLEIRELLSGNAPKIIAVQPPDGSISFSTTPALSVRFSEAMNVADAQNVANYELVGSGNRQIQITGAAYDNVTDQVTLTYNAGAGLTADRYSLFVNGNALRDAVNDLPLASVGQLVVANQGIGNVSIINVGANGALTAGSNYNASANNAQPLAVALADLTGDGIADLLMVNSATNTVDLFKGLANLRFAATPYQSLRLPSGSGAQALTVADLNNDGKLDIAVANKGTNSVSVFTNQGTGIFGAATNYSGFNGPTAIVAADFDGDGRVDLAVANGTADFLGRANISILPNNPNSVGAFLTPVNFSTNLSALTGLAVGNLDANTSPDLVVTASNGASTFFNNSTVGSFSIVFGQLLTSLPTTAAAIGNIDADANPDIVLTSTSNGGEVIILQNAGGGFFSSPSTFPAGSNPVAVALGDVNGDDKLDILVANGNAKGSVSVLLNQTGGNLSFSAPVAYTTDGTPSGIALNFNGAGQVSEVVTSNTTGNDATALLSNGDGTFIVSNDLPILPFFPQAVAYGDLNGDNIPDLVTAASSAFTGQPFTVTIQLSNPDGTFKAPVNFSIGTTTFFFGTAPTISLEDLTGDGLNDIVVADPGTSTITVIANTGNGGFAVQPSIAVGTNPTGMAFGDFNSDGKLDVAVSHSLGATSGVTVLFGNGDRTFKAPTEIGTGAFDYVGLVAGDFIQDPMHPGSLDLAVLDGSQASQVLLFQNNGAGVFTQFLQPFAAGTDATSIAAADFNADGLLDVVVSNEVPPVAGGVTTSFLTTLLGQNGTGFRSSSLRTNVLTNSTATLQSVHVIDLNQDLFPDVVVETTGSSNNVYTLQGVGDGTFTNSLFYEVDGGSKAGPSVLAVSTDPFIRATTFTVATNRVTANLVLNGSFDSRDLNGENGNLNGWQTFQIVNTAGAWSNQTGTVSPLSGLTVPQPTDGLFAAMLDQSQLSEPIQSLVSDFGVLTTRKGLSQFGTNIMYQDIFVPTGASAATLSLSLFLDSGAQFTNTLSNSSLDYRSTAANQQVRIDIMSPTANILDVGSGVLLNVFRSNPLTPQLEGYLTISANLTQFAGKTIRLRISGVNNQSRLIVGVDNVQVSTVYTDTQQPILNGLKLRNPGYGQTATFGGNSTDPTIVGTASDDGSVNNIAAIQVDPLNNGFGNADDYQVTDIDALGNFVTTLPSFFPDGTQLLPGPITVAFRVLDRAGNTSTIQRITFNYQGPSTKAFQALGPGPTRYTGQGVNFATVSGEVQSLVTDPSDPSGNTIYAAAANGGIWKTTDGGADWTPLTDYITDSSGHSVPVPAGYITISPSQPNVIYVATGLADNETGSQPGFGVVKSSDAGQTWQVVGANVFVGARVAKIQASALTPDGKIRIYAAVASGGQFGPGVYMSSDGGTTWANELTPASMFLDGGGNVAAGTQLASVTDLVIDPFSTNQGSIWIGLGNMGLEAASTTAGVWFSSNNGATWLQIPGGHDPLTNSGIAVLNQTIPTGLTVGRVTIGLPTARTTDEGVVYVFIATPGGGGVLQDGTSQNRQQAAITPTGVGLYKTVNGGLSWTGVMLKESVPIAGNPEHFVNLFLMGNEASDVSSLVVDPSNADVVYVGGSQRFKNATDRNGTLFAVPYHAFLRVDTSNMRDTNYESPYDTTATIPNDGDDRTKAGSAAEQSTPFAEPGSYPTGSNGGGYAGEGVFWYDMSSTLFGQDFNGFTIAPLVNVPNAIQDLQFDSSGRLLVATDGGIFRAVLHNFTYDVTSGGTGIESFLGIATPTEQTPTWTDLNGNLQISEMTSVAIDPYNRGALDASANQTGFMQTSGGLTWNSTVDAFFNGFGGDTFSDSAPFSGTVLTAPANPNLPAGSPASVYRDFQFVVELEQQIELSATGGAAGTFTPVVDGLNLSNVSNTKRLPIAISSTLTPTSAGVLEPSLMFWTNRIFASNDGGTSWHPVSTDLVPASGASVTSLAFGNTNNEFWVGTDQGQVYIDLHGGADNFPLRNAGLPTAPVNDIAVDPTSDMTGYLAMGGTGGHVFMTTDAGNSWTDISANLPNVAATSIAIDSRRSPSAPEGTIYAGTEVGVYFSINKGASWTRLGNIKNANGTVTQTFPNVPVSDIQINTAFNELVIATLGRGAFMISLNTSGPAVTAVTPATPVTPGLSSIVVTFNEPVDPRTFTLNQILKLQGPGGPISPLTIKDLDLVNHNKYQITFLPQSLDGTYTITLGTGIADFTGLALDQNQNGVPGQVPTDQFTANFVVNSTDDGRFITGAFNDLLNRPADTAGFLNFSTSVDGARFGLLPGQALSIVTSDAARLSTISNSSSRTSFITNGPVETNYYQGLLHRQASVSDANFWLGQLKAGASAQQIIAAIAGSDEYFALLAIGAQDGPFVTQLFRDLLGRPADPASLTFFTQKLSQSEQGSRQGVAAGFLNSNEYRQLLINSSYTEFLGRLPSAAESNFWLPQLQGGLTDEAFIAVLVGGVEFFNSPLIVTPGTPNGTNGTNDAWLQAAFFDILGRAPDAAAISGFTAQLNSGASRTSIALQLLTTNEYRTKLVQADYQTYLGHAPDSATLNFFVSALASGATDEAVVALLVSSAEYYAGHAGGATTHPQQNTNWVNAIYLSLLKRPFDPAGQAFAVKQLDLADSQARTNIAFFFANSTEYLTDLIKNVYQNSAFLGRTAGAGDVTIWLNFLQQPAQPGANNVERFLAQITGSGEFFARFRQSNNLATNNQWVQQVFLAVLNRGPTFNELHSNLTQLENNYAQQRLAVATIVDTSTEYYQVVVKSYFQQYLHRQPNGSELVARAAELKAGASDQQLQAELISSSEYVFNATHGTGDNSLWLNQVYLDLLNRNRDQAGSQGFLNGLNSVPPTLTRQQVVSLILKSNEYQDDLIASFYSKYLNRTNPSSSDLAFWVSALNKGTTNEQIIAQFIASNEYFQENHQFP